MPLSPFIQFLSLTLAFVLFAEPRASAQNSEDVEAGKTVYMNNCAVCHGDDASGKTEIAKTLNVTIPDYRSETVHKLSDDEIKQVITQGKGTMPPVADLGPRDVVNLIAFIRSFPLEQAGQQAPGSATRGEALFAGRTAFTHGGPACAACHSISSLPFPKGGTLGPDLTNEYKKLGLAGTNAALKTLFFPTMVPLYDPHPLTLAEQADLRAFLESSGAQTRSRDITAFAAAACVLGYGVFLLITWAVWRKRLISVRRKLVTRAMRRGERAA